MLQHQREATRSLQGVGLAPQLLLGSRFVRLAAVAQLVHRLGRQPQVAHHRDAGAHQPVDHREGFRLSPLQLHGRRRRFLEHPPGGRHGRIDAALIAEEGQIADDRRRAGEAAQAAAHGPAVVQHLLEGDRQGGGMAEHGHRQGIAHQHGIGPGFAHQGGGERIPGREHRDGKACLLAPRQITGSLGHGARCCRAHC